MSNSMNYNYPLPANYSGVTINISNPAVNVPQVNPPCVQGYCTQPVNQCGAVGNVPYIADVAANNPQMYLPAGYSQPVIVPGTENLQNVPQALPQAASVNQIPQNNSSADNMNQVPSQAYPSNYYLNNYNYIQDSKTGGDASVQPANVPVVTDNAYMTVPSAANAEADTNTSDEIIADLDAKSAEEKELEKNGVKTKVTALTNEYIMSLENYLNNPNTDIRLMASKEILKRLDEDHDRYNDAALNALLNKMLQDPNKLVRIAALSAFSSELASGNDYTVELLQKIQQNPDADPQDVLEASQILLKRSAETEVRYVQAPQKTEPQTEKA